MMGYKVIYTFFFGDFSLGSNGLTDEQKSIPGIARRTVSIRCRTHY